MGVTMSQTVLIAEDNLFFHAKLEGQLKTAGYQPIVVSSQERFDQALVQQPVAMLVSVAMRRAPWAEWVKTVRSRFGASFPVIGYGGHVNEAALAAGVAAGCTTVVTNGQLSAQAPALIARYVATP